MDPTIKLLVIGLLTAATCHAEVIAPSADASSRATRGNSSAADFVSKAIMEGMTEIQAAQLALQKSQNHSIKQFAEQMVGDHTKVDAELIDIAANRHIRAPTELDAAHRSMLQALGAKSDAAFDLAFVAQMAASHDKAIALFKYGKASNDPDVIAFATKTLPTLQIHRHMVTDLQSGLGKSQPD